MFIDEAPINAGMGRTSGHSPRGEPAVVHDIVHVPALRNPNVTLIAAISPSHGVLLQRTKIWGEQVGDMSVPNNLTTEESEALKPTKGVGTRDFLMSIKDLLSLPEMAGINYIVLDNMRFHKSDLIKQAVPRAGKVLKYLPPYSPFLNPIEEVFSEWKAAVKRAKSADADACRNEIGLASVSVTPAHCLAHFNHSVTYYDRCINREDDLI